MRTIWWVSTGNNVRWIAVGQWKRKLDVEERQMRSAELDDVDERIASYEVEGSGREKWDVCPVGRSGIWTGRIVRPGVFDIELHVVVEVVGHDADVVVGVKDCVVVRDDDGEVVSLGRERRQGPEEVHESSFVVDMDWTSPVGDLV